MLFDRDVQVWKWVDFGCIGPVCCYLTQLARGPVLYIRYLVCLGFSVATGYHILCSTGGPRAWSCSIFAGSISRLTCCRQPLFSEQDNSGSRSLFKHVLSLGQKGAIFNLLAACTSIDGPEPLYLGIVRRA